MVSRSMMSGSSLLSRSVAFAPEWMALRTGSVIMTFCIIRFRRVYLERASSSSCSAFLTSVWTSWSESVDMSSSCRPEGAISMAEVQTKKSLATYC
jgi:hypothetical protein